MKKFKKIMAILVAAMMIMATMVPAWAATITVQNVDGGQTYKAYKLLEYTTNLSDSDINLDRTNAADEAKIDAGSFAYYLPKANYSSSGAATAEEGSLGAALYAAGLRFAKSADGTNYYVTNSDTLTDGVALSAAIKTAINGMADNKFLGVSQIVTDADATTASFTNLSTGYWFITSTTGTLLTLETIDTVAAVFDKNQEPSCDKDIASIQKQGQNSPKEDSGASNEESGYATASIGDTVNYTVAISAKKGAENYIYHDSLSDGLTLLGDAPVVSAEITLADSSKYTLKATDYEVLRWSTTQAVAADTLTNEEDNDIEVGDNITIRFKKDFLDKITRNETITITYSALLNAGATVEGTGNENGGRLEYGHAATRTMTPVDEPRVYTFKFQVVKDDDHKELLTGAEFKLYDAETGGHEIKVVAATGGYRPALSTEAASAVVIAAGTPILQGFDIGTYYLEETTAPDGYNKLPARVKVEIVKDENTVNTSTWTAAASKVKVGTATDATLGLATFEDIDSDTVVEYASGGVEVVNDTRPILPSTGGMGTTVLYIVGGMLVILAGAYLFFSRKKTA